VPRGLCMELPDTETLLHTAQKSMFPRTDRENATLKSKSTNAMCPKRKRPGSVYDIEAPKFCLNL